MKPDYLQQTIDTYNKGVKTFISNTEENRIEEEVATFINLLPHSATVLDAGCAYGQDTVSFCTNENNVYGIDLAEAFIREAKQRVHQAHFSADDIRHLGFKDETFDGIWARAVLLHLTLEDMVKSLREFYRVLKPGGTLFVHMKKGTGSKTIDDSKSMTQGARFFTFVEEDQLRELLGKADFEILDLFSYNGKQRFGENRRDIWWIDAFAKKV